MGETQDDIQYNIFILVSKHHTSTGKRLLQMFHEPKEATFLSFYQLAEITQGE